MPACDVDWLIEGLLVTVRLWVIDGEELSVCVGVPVILGVDVGEAVALSVGDCVELGVRVVVSLALSVCEGEPVRLRVDDCVGVSV